MPKDSLFALFLARFGTDSSRGAYRSIRFDGSSEPTRHTRFNSDIAVGAIAGKKSNSGARQRQILLQKKFEPAQQPTGAKPTAAKQTRTS